MQEEWWKKLRSESVKDRLPVVWMIVKIGFGTYVVILAMLLVFLPWKKETKPVKSQLNSLDSLKTGGTTESLIIRKMGL